MSQANAIYADNSNRLLIDRRRSLFVQIIITMIAIVWFALDPLGDGSLEISCRLYRIQFPVAFFPIPS